MRSIQLRSAVLADSPALGVLHVASWHETYTGMLPDEVMANLSVEARIAMWAKILGDPAASGGTAVYLAEDAGEVVGFGACGPQHDEALTVSGFDGEIGALYILRSHQRLNIGRAIMRVMAQAMLRQARGGAALWVLRENVPARNFYERLGGVVVREEKQETHDTTLLEVAYGWRDLSLLGR